MSFQRQTEKFHRKETEQIMKKKLNRMIKKRTCSSFTDNHHLNFAAATAACCSADNCRTMARERCTLNACVGAFCVHSMAQHAHMRLSVAIAINVMEAMEDRRMPVYGLYRPYCPGTRLFETGATVAPPMLLLIFILI